MALNQRKDESKADSLDLDGLEGLLDHAHLEVAGGQEQSEVQLIGQLLDQLCNITEIIAQTNQRLTAARERLASLTKLVDTQEKQLELLGHYQEEAARAISLENQLEIANAQLEHLRRPIVKKLMFWTK